MTKFHFLQFQKWPKINFTTGKKFKTAKNVRKFKIPDQKTREINFTKKNFWQKFIFLELQKWPKINFSTGKIAKNAILRKNNFFLFI